MLEQIQELIPEMTETLRNEYQTRGETVAIDRRYAIGEHDAKMSSDMKAMLNLSDSGNDSPFAINNCDLIIQTENDRLAVTGIDGDSDQASAWSEELLSATRFDGLQRDVHEATLRDGDAFIMPEWNDITQQVELFFEPAWDGETGMGGVYDATQRVLVAAFKVWEEGDKKRVNLYFPGEIQKYITSADGTDLQKFEPENWPTPWNETVGIPIVHFRNRNQGGSAFGISELKNVIPLQNALNRILTSMVMASELSAFQIKVAKFFEPPQEVMPGMWVKIPGPISKEDHAPDADVLEQAELVPFIQEAEFISAEMGRITRTPMPEHMGGDTQSGEALKQREIGLLGKVKGFQIKAGNAWEDTLALAHRMQQTYGTNKPPASERWTTRWQDAQIRNDKETVENALALRDIIGDKETLKIISGIAQFGWDDQRIEQILKEKREEASLNVAALGNSFNSFPAFGGAAIETEPPNGRETAIVTTGVEA